MLPESPPAEAFRPLRHRAPSTLAGRLLFRLRLAVDLQTASICRDLAPRLRPFRGRILDVGCGASPFRHLLDPALAAYAGIDVPAAEEFGYRNPDTICFDGEKIPFPDGSFDGLLCTEVLEHVADPGPLVAEMHRVLKPGGFAIVTIPWSARFHYQPFDFHRYAPPMLQRIFAGFRQVDTRPRGTDLSSIAAKIVVAFFRNLRQLASIRPRDLWFAPLRIVAALAGLPVLLAALVLGHLGLRAGLGSSDDPLGYTVVARR